MKSINPNNAIIFLLKREYIRECKIESGTDENGNHFDRAVHPMNLTFDAWMLEHKISINHPKIIQPNFTK